MQVTQTETYTRAVPAFTMDVHGLQSDAILPVSFSMYLAALTILSIEELMPGYSGLIWPATFILVLATAISLLKARSLLTSAWMLMVGLVIVIMLMVVVGQAHVAVFLLAFPAGLAMFFINVPAGIGIAAACTLLLLFMPALTLDPVERVLAIIQIWGTTGMMALAERPLMSMVEWTWSSYEQSRDLLERAREYQMQLKQALQDLADANLQLSRLNEQARVMRQVAEDARRAKEQFIANVSHELRTPLNMILGFSEMLMQSSEIYETKLPPALMADLSVIRRNSQHLASLIDDVLDLSQIEAGSMALTRERVDLCEIIDAAMVGVLPLFRSKGLYLEKDVSDDLPQIYCDRTRLREVILNLLSNAGRFTERGGVRIRAWRDGNDALVSVTDTGPGIKAADKQRLFKPFQQADGSIRRRFGGTGLGLSISKSFIEMHGGSMWLESTVGVGTSVSFRIPIDPPTRFEPDAAHWLNPEWEYKERPRSRAIGPVVVRPRLVLCEKGDTLQKLFSRYLDRIETVQTRSLEAAIEELESVPSQALVINDVAVGSTLQLLNSSVTLPVGTPAIVCSLPDANALRSSGVSGYLVKPISRAALLAALDRLALTGQTILIVDDEPEAVRLFRRMLVSSGRGYRVLAANDGEHAMRILQAQRPDALLLDLIMPNMDGFQVLARKNEDAGLRGIPVVVLSAQDPAGEPIVSNALGITQGGGLSVQKLLALVETTLSVLLPSRWSNDLALIREQPDLPASAETLQPPASAPSPVGA